MSQTESNKAGLCRLQPVDRRLCVRHGICPARVAAAQLGLFAS